MIDSKKYDYVIIGSGAIAWITCLYLSETATKSSIAVISELPRYYSASTAAGAMHAVFGEIEDDISKSKEERRSFEVALKSRRLWKYLFNKYDLNSVITANDTAVYLQKNSSRFENYNYKLVKELASKHKCMEEMDRADRDTLFENAIDKPSEAIILKDEFSFCTETLFKKLKKIIQSKNNVALIDKKCKSIRHVNKETIYLEIDNEDAVCAKNVIVAAGSQSGKLLNDYPMQRMLQSVGAALKIKIPNIEQFKNISVRSVNRGGAQCGIHAVPRADSVYIGAGSYVTAPSVTPEYRTDTIRYLINCAESELFGKSQIYKSSMETILGSRPRSIDARPLIGAFKEYPNLLVATGTNRVGLTWAPAIAEYLLGILGIKELRDKELFEDWYPDRDLMMFGSTDYCIDYYVSSRLSNEREHGLIDPSYKDIDKKRIQDYAETLVKEVNKTLGIKEKESIHPDGWGTIAKLSDEFNNSRE